MEAFDIRLKNVESILMFHSELLDDIRNMISFLINRQRLNCNSKQSGLEKSLVESERRSDKELLIDDIPSESNKTILPLTKRLPENFVLPKKLKDLTASENQDLNWSRSFKTERSGYASERKIADSSINQIFSPSQIKMSKKKLIIEPIDVCTEQIESRTVHGNYTSRNTKKPAVILNLINASRNNKAEKSKNAFNAFPTEKNKPKYFNNTVKMPIQINNIKSSGRNSKIIEKPLLKTSIKSQTTINSPHQYKLEEVSGNCIGLIMKFLGDKLSLLLCSKKIFINYLTYKLRRVKEKMESYNQSNVI